MKIYSIEVMTELGRRVVELTAPIEVEPSGAMAPPFRSLHERYPVENLQESLAEGIVTGHPSMPEFRLDPDQITDVIAYLKTLEAGR